MRHHSHRGQRVVEGQRLTQAATDVISSTRAGDGVAIAGYLGGSDVFDRALADFAEAYAEQNARDFEEVRAAVADGTIEAQPGV
jgi:hypothetical protein